MSGKEIQKSISICSRLSLDDSFLPHIYLPKLQKIVNNFLKPQFFHRIFE